MIRFLCQWQMIRDWLAYEKKMAGKFVNAGVDWPVIIRSVIHFAWYLGAAYCHWRASASVAAQRAKQQLLAFKGIVAQGVTHTNRVAHVDPVGNLVGLTDNALYGRLPR